MANAVEAFRQHVDQEPADKLRGGKRHGLVAARSLDAIVLEREGHGFLIGRDEPPVGDGDAMGVAGKIGQHSFRPGQRTLGIHEPVDGFEGREISFEGGVIGKVRQLAEEPEFAGFVGRCDLFQHEPPKQRRENHYGQ